MDLPDLWNRRWTFVMKCGPYFMYPDLIVNLVPGSSLFKEITDLQDLWDRIRTFVMKCGPFLLYRALIVNWVVQILMKLQNCRTYLDKMWNFFHVSGPHREFSDQLFKEATVLPDLWDKTWTFEIKRGLLR